MVEIVAALITGFLALAATVVGVALARQGTRQQAARSPAPVKRLPATAVAEVERGSFAAEFVTKVVDLRSAHVAQTGEPAVGHVATKGGIVEVTDWYLLRRVANTSDTATFFYATNGSLRARSLSHATGQRLSTSGEHLRMALRLDIDLALLPEGRIEQVVNTVEYLAAFEGPDGDFIETHIDRPTRSLTWVVQFAPDRPCLAGTGRARTGRTAWSEPPGPRPLLLHQGTLLIWTIAAESGRNLDLNTEYRLDWTWRDSTQTNAEPMITIAVAEN